jgi:hypothetical protein
MTVELQWWPCARPIMPLDLFRLNSVGEAMLTARLPRRLPTALATAEMALSWVTGRWPSGDDTYTRDEDANRLLDRAAAGARYGERFGAAEYTLVLTQALNALRIPARRLRGLPDGQGSVHPMTEAWIDDLGGWAVFDGRNGATWRDPGGTPLGVVDLQRLYRAKEMPEFQGAGQNFRASDAARWFEFFHTVAVTDGLAWSAGPYLPVAADGTVLRCARLADSDVDAAPDLAAISTSVTGSKDRPALLFRTDHPYAIGFTITEGTTSDDRTETVLEPDQPLPLAGGQPGEPGEHRLTVATRTPYGTLAAHHLHYRTDA